MKNKDSSKSSGMSIIRESVIYLMESIPELGELEGEEWFAAEDSIVEHIESIIKRRK